MACLKSKLKTLSSFLTIFIFFVISIFPNNSYSYAVVYQNTSASLGPVYPYSRKAGNPPPPPNPNNSHVGNIETAYMVELMNALTPAPFSWSTNIDVCVWSGVSCRSGYVYRIELSNMSLTGTLPSGLNKSLFNLTKLDLSMSSLSGPLPSLTNLNKLQEVYLNGNNFTSIPDGCFQGLTGLGTLSLSNNVNLASWKFPNDLTGSPALKALYLSDNNLWGSIPGSLAKLPQLEVLDVSNNNLSGNIPKFSPMVRLNITGNILLSQANGTSPSSVSQANGTSPRNMPSSSTKASLSTRLIAASIGAGVIAIFVVVIYNRKRCFSFVQKMVFKNTRTFADQIIEDFIRSYGSLAPKQYSYSEVKRMTNSLQDKLGQGGYGTVYKASLMDGRQVAVKILSESKGNGEEFINEVASISRTSHVNIVSLLGFCYEKKKRALIYEFMSNGSLDKFICNKGSLNAICNLDWNILFQITIGIARGLEYLHRGCNTRILHLDIKPQNILLDEEFCPKIADFGLAKICKKKESIVSILGPRGTPGYIAPEVFSRAYGGVSHKSDVYSYGMLILEVVGGRNNYDTGGSHSSEMYFPDWIYKDLERGNIPARCLAHTEEESDMIMKITLVSLWCIQPNPSDRPSMNKVVEMLEGSLQSVPYPPKPILYSLERPTLQFSNISHSSRHETISITP